MAADKSYFSFYGETKTDLEKRKTSAQSTKNSDHALDFFLEFITFYKND